MRNQRALAWRQLTAVERDALIVLTAMCKVGGGWGRPRFHVHLLEPLLLFSSRSERPSTTMCNAVLCYAVLCRWHRARLGLVPWRATCTR